MRLPTQKHTLASACNRSSSRNSYLAGIIDLLIDIVLEARDGAAVQHEPELRIEVLADTEIVLVDAI